jgi:hypothetical protein
VIAPVYSGLAMFINDEAMVGLDMNGL